MKSKKVKINLILKNDKYIKKINIISVMKTNLKIKNFYSEELDVEILGNKYSNKILIMVHGFGTNKHEGFNLFDDIAKEFLDSYLIIRYDCSGFGKSQGTTLDFSIQKGAEDFNVILNYTRKHYFNFEISILAHSMGLYFSTMFLPLDIKQFIFTGIPNINSQELKNALINRIKNSGGKFNENGISTYKRSSGATQEFGSNFFKSFDNFSCINNISYLINKNKEVNIKNNIVMFRPIQDEIVKQNNFELFIKLLNEQFIELNGDHNFTNIDDRKELIKQIKFYL